MEIFVIAVVVSNSIFRDGTTSFDFISPQALFITRLALFDSTLFERKVFVGNREISFCALLGLRERFPIINQLLLFEIGQKPGLEVVKLLLPTVMLQGEYL